MVVTTDIRPYESGRRDVLIMTAYDDDVQWVGAQKVIVHAANNKRKKNGRGQACEGDVRGILIHHHPPVTQTQKCIACLSLSHHVVSMYLDPDSYQSIISDDRKRG